MFFQVPPPTRFDLNFSVAGIRVRVHPLFWVIATWHRLYKSFANCIGDICYFRFYPRA
jgi:hypothetical protein